MRWLRRGFKPDWPEIINGFETRPRRGTCPGCGAPEDRWCGTGVEFQGCPLLDPMDYR